jgi:hypothetical protein
MASGTTSFQSARAARGGRGAQIATGWGRPRHNRFRGHRLLTLRDGIGDVSHPRRWRLTDCRRPRRAATGRARDRVAETVRDQTAQPLWRRLLLSCLQRSITRLSTSPIGPGRGAAAGGAKAFRATLLHWSPTCVTASATTSSTSSGSIPARSITLSYAGPSRALRGGSAKPALDRVPAWDRRPGRVGDHNLPAPQPLALCCDIALF